MNNEKNWEIILLSFYDANLRNEQAVQESCKKSFQEHFSTQRT